MYSNGWPLALLLTGCGPRILGIDPTNLGKVVADDLGDGQVLDARSPEQALAGHVPGAIRVHWTELSGGTDPDHDAALLAERGLDEHAPVVIYGSGPRGLGDAGDLYWPLRYLGHPGVQVLDGGWEAWLADGGEPAQGTAPPSTCEAQVDDSVLATTSEVAGWEGVLLDVRSEAEWQEGHIPGATWLPWTAVFAPDGTLLPETELRALLGSVGVERDTPVITYCEAGIRVGHTFMVLEALGGEGQVRNYAGSWRQWVAAGGDIEK